MCTMNLRNSKINFMKKNISSSIAVNSQQQLSTRNNIWKKKATAYDTVCINYIFKQK